jgi:hypothetical protein
MNHLKPNCTGIDCPIKTLQQTLYPIITAKWGEVEMYGRATRNTSKAGNLPEVYDSKRRYMEVLLDSKKLGQVFFLEGSRHDNIDEGMFSAPLKVVFFLNLDKFEQSAHKDERRDDLAQKQAYQWIDDYFFDFDISGLEKTMGEVFAGYNIDKSLYDDIHPFHVFAITGSLMYELKNNC